MAGILIQLALSWLLLWLIQKQHLNVLGFYPTRQRLTDFFWFLLLSAGCSAMGFLLRMWWGNEKWEINPLFTTRLLWEGIWWNVKSVLFEELIFRGALLYILIKRLGPLKAIIISAAGFGVYHWFSYGILGNVPQMIIYFFVTGIMGLIYAYGYAKTFSLYIPAAIHFGWNFVQSFVFSKGVIGNGILVLAKHQTPVTISTFAYACIMLLPLLSIWGIAYWLLKRHAQVTASGA
jgi:uncharacterized protein